IMRNVLLAITFIFGCYYTSLGQIKSKDPSWSGMIPVITDSIKQLPLFNVSLAETQEGIYTFGNTLPDIWYYDKSWAKKVYAGNERLIAINPQGYSMPVPEGNFTFSYPKVLSDSVGTIHLLWAEPDSSAKETDRYQTIWHARYIDGLWSDPKMIYHAHAIIWKEASRFFIDDQGIFHLIFSAEEKRLNDISVGLTHLFKDQTGWHKNFGDPPRAITCAYIDVATHAGKLLMSCIRPDHDSSREDRNSVFFSSSTDNGQSWNEPVLVSHSGKKQAPSSQLMVSSNGTVQLLWLKSTDTDFMPETIW